MILAGDYLFLGNLGDAYRLAQHLKPPSERLKQRVGVGRDSATA